MRFPQIRTNWYNPITRRDVRSINKHNKREDLFIFMVLVCIPARRLRSGSRLEIVINFNPCTQQCFQSIDIRQIIQRWFGQRLE